MLAFALKVFLLTSIASSERTRALSYPRMPMFVPKRLPRVLFLDEDDFGRGEIDLTDKRLPKINFEPDYKGNDRLYSIPTFYQGRFGRPYAPSFAFEQIQIAPPRNGFYPPTNGWKARSPRVVFPYNPDTSNSIHTNSHTAPSIDNVVFREQSIGTNDVAAEDQLQDISGDAFSERDAIVPHRAHKRIDERTKYYQKKTFILRKPMFVQKETTKRNFNEYPNATVPEFRPISDAQITKINEIMKDILSKPNYRKGKMLDSETSETRDIATELPEKDRKYDDGCPQGGTCEFFLSCWMKGGLLEGSCDGLLKSCCHKVAKSGLLGVQDLNSIESPFEGFSYGPVINDDIIKTFNVYKEKTLRSEKILQILDKSGLVTQRCELRNNGLTELMWSWQDIGRELELEYGDVQDDGCGVATSKQTAQRRIVGGDDAGFGTFPWQAYIRIGSSRCNMLMSIFELIGWKQCWIERCGGSLISRRHVVTAGHCVARAQPRHVRVTLGDYVINSAAEPLPAYTFGVRTIKVHPLFKFTPQADRFDVAVLTLDRNVHYMPHIAPICLPERGSDFLGQYGWAAGWGALSPGSRLRPRTLQAVDVPVLDNRVCERWHRANGINVVIYPEMLCAGYRGGGKDSCQGDSGGPLMLERAGRWYLIGVVSAGYSCASRGQPGIYHRVAHTVDWISHATTLA